MPYRVDEKRQVHAAFEDALDRVDGDGRQLDDWELACLSEALQAMAAEGYGFARQRIEDCFDPVARRAHAATRPTVATFRSALAMLKRRVV